MVEVGGCCEGAVVGVLMYCEDTAGVLLFMVLLLYGYCCFGCYEGAVVGVLLLQRCCWGVIVYGAVVWGAAGVLLSTVLLLLGTVGVLLPPEGITVWGARGCVTGVCRVLLECYRSMWGAPGISGVLYGSVWYSRDQWGAIWISGVFQRYAGVLQGVNINTTKTLTN